MELEMANQNVHCVVLSVRVFNLIFLWRSLIKLRECLGDRYIHFDQLNSIEKRAYVLGRIFSLVKE